jgi:hypothetical protein
MSLTTITVTGSYPAGAGSSVATGFITFVPTARIVNAVGHTIIPQLPIQVQLQLGAFSLPNVVTNDNAGLTPAGWAWEITENINGVQADPYYVFILSTFGDTVDLAQLTEATPGPIITAYANINAANTFTEPNTFADGLTVTGPFELDGTGIATPPGGTAEYLRADGTWDIPAGSGGGAVTSVFGRTGQVTAEAGDYAMPQVSTIVATKTAAYTLTTSDEVILADATFGTLPLTLPTAVGSLNQYTIKKVDASTNPVAIGTTGGQAIDGGSSAEILVQYASITLVPHGDNWWIT